MIRSELKFLIGGKIVHLKCPLFGRKMGPCCMVRVIGVVRTVATVRNRVEPYPDPTREFGPVANSIRRYTVAVVVGDAVDAVDIVETVEPETVMNLCLPISKLTAILQMNAGSRNMLRR
jgi:hypothetical protein